MKGESGREGKRETESETAACAGAGVRLHALRMVLGCRTNTHTCLSWFCINLTGFATRNFQGFWDVDLLGKKAGFDCLQRDTSLPQLKYLQRLPQEGPQGADTWSCRSATLVTL